MHHQLFSLGDALYVVDYSINALRKVAVGSTKIQDGETYRLNENHRWERINKNIARTARKLEGRQDQAKLQWISDRISSAGDDYASSDAIDTAASRLEEGKNAAEARQKYPDAHNPKKLKSAIQAELAKPNPKIGTLRKIARIATEGAESLALLNEDLAFSLELVAEQANEESNLLQSAKELKQNKEHIYSLTDGRLERHETGETVLPGIDPIRFSISVVMPSTEKVSQDLLDRYARTQDEWMKQAIAQEMMASPRPGAVKRENWGEGDRYYRYGELPDGKKTMMGGRFAYQEIKPEDLTEQERSWLDK